MTLKKTVAIFVLVALSVSTAVSLGWVGTATAYFLDKLFDEHIPPFFKFLFRLVFIAIMAAICAVIAYRFALKERIVFLLALTFLGAYILRLRSIFYVKRDHPVVDDANLPDCYWEHNYDSFWDYLTKSCHLSVSDFTKMVVERTFVLIIVFLVVYWLMRRRSKGAGRIAVSDVIDK